MKPDQKRLQIRQRSGQPHRSDFTLLPKQKKEKDKSPNFFRRMFFYSRSRTAKSDKKLSSLSREPTAASGSCDAAENAAIASNAELSSPLAGYSRMISPRSTRSKKILIAGKKIGQRRHFPRARTSGSIRLRGDWPSAGRRGRFRPSHHARCTFQAVVHSQSRRTGWSVTPDFLAAFADQSLFFRLALLDAAPGKAIHPGRDDVRRTSDNQHPPIAQGNRHRARAGQDRREFFP